MPRAASRSGLFAPSNMVTSSRTGQRQYAAAKVSRLTGDWMPVGQSVNQLLRTSAPAVTRRVRQLVRDFPYFTRAANIMVDFTVGTGHNFQSRVLNPGWKPGVKGVAKFDRAICQKIEDAVAWGMEELDAAGRLHGADLERLSKLEEVEAGEFLFVKVLLSDPQRYIPYALQPIEAEWLTDYNAQPNGSNRIERGIEYDPLTGRAIAYHLADPDNHLQPRRVEAQHILHGFDTRRSGQMRGISPFVAAVIIANDLDDYVGATIDTAKSAARYLALIHTDNPGGFQAPRTTDGTGEDTGKKIEELENAIVEYLRPGEQITFAKNDNPGTTFDPFTKFILRTVAISALTNNHADYNYTSLRGERQDTLKIFEPHQVRHSRQFKAPVVRDIITNAVIKGRLDLPGYFKDPRRYWRGVHIAPGMEPIDPLRESKANRDDIASGLRSPQEIAAKRGRDIEEVLDELAEFHEMAAERGLVLDVGSTALANNPAAIEAGSGGAAATDDPAARDQGPVDFEETRKKFDAYGIGVRSGAITPQITDEEKFREQAGLPELSEEVRKAWTSDGGVRRPVTIKSRDAFNAEQEGLASEGQEE